MRLLLILASFTLVSSMKASAMNCVSFTSNKPAPNKPGRLVFSRFDILDREFTELIFGEAGLKELSRNRARLVVVMEMNDSNPQIKFVFLPWTKNRIEDQPSRYSGMALNMGLQPYHLLNVQVNPSRMPLMPDRVTSFSVTWRELWVMIKMRHGTDAANRVITEDSSMQFEVNKYGVGRIILHNVGGEGKRDLLAGTGRASPEWIINYRNWLVKFRRNSRFQ